LNSISSGQLDVSALITDRVSLENFKDIYGDMRKKGSIASIIVYPTDSKKTNTIYLNHKTFNGRKGVFGSLGQEISPLQL